MLLSSPSALLSAKLAALSATLQYQLVGKLDEAIRDELKDFRNSYFHWLIFCTVLVLAGVVLEECDSLSIGNARLDLVKGVFVPRYGLVRWRKRIARLGWILIVVGVLGEGVFEYAFSNADELLQTFDENLLGNAQKEAAFALERAANANERAAELEQRLADRHITLEQRNKMLAILAAHHGTRVSVTFITPSSSDAQEYSVEIGGIFRDAKWTVVPFPWLSSMDTPVHGFAVEIREKGASSKRKSLERTTRGALSVLDDRIMVIPKGGLDPGPGMNLDLVILVGSK